MNTLRIHLFGGMDLFRGGRPLPAFATQRARGLFAFLALHRGRPHARDVLMGHFWGDRPEHTARKCLRTDIWRVRQVVECDGGEACIRVRQDEVGFDAASDHWLDVHEFEGRLARVPEGANAALTGETAAVLEEAVELYRGDLLEGIYDDWCLVERERLRLRFLGALERLMRWHAGRGAWLHASLLAQRLLGHDPLREHVHRDVMRFFAYAGDRPAALRQFDVCVRLLQHELEIGPMDETAALADSIRAGTLQPPPAGRTQDEARHSPPRGGQQRIPIPLRIVTAKSSPGDGDSGDAHRSASATAVGRAPGTASPAIQALPFVLPTSHAVDEMPPQVETVLARLRAAERWLDATSGELRTLIREVEQARDALPGVPHEARG
ncbi:MAG TPA: BTAD domain-containing putative transcriptional regulator [Longimicrobiaceae bacterium]|jgi:DNA-binding SARP family transcriptional activator|nr:BTAD domain-containing putative transcriptional regulator [Longimicrobiaceae bacterium]